MSGRLRRAWRARRWYDGPLAVLGLLLAALGGTFYALVAFIGAPIIPYGGLCVAAFGVWLGVLRPLWAAPEGAPEAPGEG